MDKAKTLQEVTALAQSGLVSERELRAAFEAGVAVRDPNRRSFGVSDVLSYLGAGIVVIGIAIFIGQKWDVMGSAARLLVTLGAGIAAYASAVLFGAYKQLEGPSAGFHLLGALLIPGGIHVLFVDVLGVEQTLGGTTLVACGLFLLYLVSFSVFQKKTVLLFFSTLFGTGAYFLITDWLAQDADMGEHYGLYRVLIAGLSYISLAYAFQKHELYKGMVGFLNLFGIVGFLGSALALGGYKPTEWDSILFEITYPGLALLVIFWSTYTKSRSYLVFGTLFLMGYIGKITAEYFADSVGWALSLILVGFAFIGIGYGAVFLNKKYLK